MKMLNFFIKSFLVSSIVLTSYFNSKISFPLTLLISSMSAYIYPIFTSYPYLKFSISSLKHASYPSYNSYTL